MHSVRCIVIVVMALLGLASPSLGTDRYFPDSTAISPSGRYRIDAKSPDNAAHRPFAANFTYTLTDTVTNKVIWERKQPMSRSKGSERAFPAEVSPIALFVNDDGLVAARLAHEDVIFLDPRNGTKRAEAQVVGGFPADERSSFIVWSTAGPMWAQNSQWFFIGVRSATNPAKELPYFVVRPYWNKRLIINAKTCKHVDLGSYRGAVCEQDLAGAGDEVRRVLTAAIAEETRLALAGVAVEWPVGADANDNWWPSRLSAALHSIAFLRLSQAEPDLRRWEKSLSEAGAWADSLRQKVRETLRALGFTPIAGFGVPLHPSYDVSLDTDSPYKTHVPLDQRLASAEKIVAGMTVQELTDLIGCPDAEVRWSPVFAFDYDIDSPKPFTLRVTLDQDQLAVVKVERITPFAFLHDTHRMAGTD
jgi:hypothetical protein